MVKSWRLATSLIALVGLAAAACSSSSPSSSAKPAAASTAPTSFLSRLHTMAQVASTVPANGDVNPYGVAVVPASAGKLVAGDTLVSNFNSKSNVQGTGTTLIERPVAAQGEAGRREHERGLVRLPREVRPVDDTLTNTVSAIPQALTRTTALDATASTLVAGGALNAPLGMTLAPNGDLVVVNGNDGNAVEFSPAGRQLFTKTLIKNGAGDLFGITTTAAGELVAVNDGKNVIDIYRP